MRTIVVCLLVLAIAATLYVILPRTSDPESDRAPATPAADAPADAPPPPAEPLDSTPEPPSPAPAGAAALFGRVVEAGTTRPVFGAVVAAYEYGAAATREARTDTDGRFRLRADRSGAAFHLVVTHPDYARTEVSRAHASRQPLAIEIGPGGSIRGQVDTAGGEPVADCMVSAARVLLEEGFDGHAALHRQIVPRELLLPTVPARGGKFELSRLSPGPHVLLVQADGFAPFLVEDVPVDAGKATDVRVLLPGRATFVVEVTDAATGEALTGVSFEAALSLDRRLVPFPAAARRIEGAYEITGAGLPDGRLADTKLVVTKEGYAPERMSFSGQEAGHRFRVALSRPAALRGLVLDAKAAPLPGAVLLYEREMDGGVLQSAVADETGFYEMDGLPVGEGYRLHCYDPSLRTRRAVVPLALEPGETRELDVGLPNATGIEGTVRLRGAPVPRTLVAIDTEARRIVLYTDAAGRYSVEGLAPGEYTVFVNYESEIPIFFERRVAVAAGERPELDFDARLVVRGTVVHAETGEPIRNRELDVHAYRADGPDAFSRVAADGTFVLHVDAPDVYELDCPGEEEFFAIERPRVDLRARSEVQDVRLALVRDPRDGRIVLEVVDKESGRPVADGSYHFDSLRVTGAGSFEDGRIVFDECPLGRLDIVVSSDAHVPLRRSFEITARDKVQRAALLLERSRILRVTGIEPGSAAVKAGLAAGDRIVSYDGVPVKSIFDLRSAIAAASGTVSIEIERDGKRMRAAAEAGPLGIETANER